MNDGWGPTVKYTIHRSSRRIKPLAFFSWKSEDRSRTMKPKENNSNIATDLGLAKMARSLVSKRFDRIQTGGGHGRVHTEEDSDEDRKTKTHAD